jgi:hypothetical protein
VPRRKALSDRQLGVLQWIADGFPGRDWLDESHKNSARAPHERMISALTIGAMDAMSVKLRAGSLTAEIAVS